MEFSVKALQLELWKSVEHKIQVLYTEENNLHFLIVTVVMLETVWLQMLHAADCQCPDSIYFECRCFDRQISE